MATYTDWEVSKEHASVLQASLPSPLRRAIQVRKYIEGMTGQRIGKGLRHGVWVKPLGSVAGTTFSCVQDVTHRSLVVIVSKSTTGQSEQAPAYDVYRQAIRKLFHNRRGTRLTCEIYSSVSEQSYEIDEAVQREMDVDILTISSRFREDR